MVVEVLQELEDLVVINGDVLAPALMSYREKAVTVDYFNFNVVTRNYSSNPQKLHCT